MGYMTDFTRAPAVDSEGFLEDPGEWNHDIARYLASRQAAPPLGGAHWLLIDELHEDYERLGEMAVLSRFYRTFGEDWQAVEALFGSCLEAWRLAGLPNPGPATAAFLTRH